uniref:Epstein-Barr virus EBNA-1-like protein n=1 Tax=Oryza sativa subsp. japonica TaxID=39947 RepID=Q5SMR0_ORYSJ|nr:Epstein-Barr virus EBNA-1-like protein [Oryza sativa Japonica Group]
MLAPTWRLRGCHAGRRERQPAAGEEGNGDEVTRGRFPAVRASTRLRELDASVGLGGTTPSEAGDERVLRSSGGDGGEHTASDGNGGGNVGLETDFGGQGASWRSG